MWIIGVRVALRVCARVRVRRSVVPESELVGDVVRHRKVAIYALLAAPTQCKILLDKVSDIGYFGHTALGFELAISTEHGSPGNALFD